MRGKIVFIKNPECVSEAIAILGDFGNLLVNFRLLYLKYFIVNILDTIISMIMTYIFHKIIITIFLDITVIESKLF